MDVGRTPSGGPPMVRIDGEHVRGLREALGLTQLYVATAVGVTTDTISRWENRRYPSIKRENALRLAEALEVPLEDILEEQRDELPLDENEEESVPAGKPEEVAKPERWWENPLFRWTVPAVLVVFGIGVGLWSFFPDGGHIEIRATRLLPPHAAPGQVFPVVISLEILPPESLSLILKEVLPEACTPLQAEPAFTAEDRNENTVKWIRQTDGQVTTFAYLVRMDPSTPLGSVVRFSGDVTVKWKHGITTGVSGSDALEARHLHWADTDGDHAIDDEEILTVYDELKNVSTMDFGRTEMEEIWSVNGYSWDDNRQTFVGAGTGTSISPEEANK